MFLVVGGAMALAFPLPFFAGVPPVVLAMVYVAVLAALFYAVCLLSWIYQGFTEGS